MSTTTAPSEGLVSLLGIDPAAYEPHALHRGERTYTETNCYADILIELLHAAGHEPLAVLGSTLRLDFEGDQWTFFKPAPGDIEALFGVDIHEMQPHRALPDQIAEQLASGRTLAVELDSIHLPDTAATSYRHEHVKSSVIPEAIDREGRRLRYFHNAGLYELQGEDFDAVLRVDGIAHPDVLPPYTELVRFDAGPVLRGDELRARSRELSRDHLSRRPKDNPFLRFGARLEHDLPALLEGDAADYHTYAFATVRMAGAGFDVASAHVAWLLGAPGAVAVEALERIAATSKVLSFRLARRRAFDPAPLIDELAHAWDEAMAALDALLS